MTSVEIAGVTAELDCETDRAQQLIDQLSRAESRKINWATVSSITVGAIITVLMVQDVQALLVELSH